MTDEKPEFEIALLDLISDYVEITSLDEMISALELRLHELYVDAEEEAKG